MAGRGGARGLGSAAPKRSSPGGQPLYSELAIELVLTLQLVFQLALRQAEAFSRSVLRLLGLALPVPDHSTLSSRSRSRAFAGRQPRVQASGGLVHLVLDSTGLELFGQDEWDAEKHGRARRQWRKLHLAADAGIGEIAAYVLTGCHADDAAQVPALLGTGRPRDRVRNGGRRLRRGAHLRGGRGPAAPFAAGRRRLAPGVGGAKL